MTLVIKNVKEEYLGAFKEFAEKMEANLAESSDDFGKDSSECPIYKSHNYEPSYELLEAIREVEQGEVIHCKDFEEYKANIDNE